MRNQKLITLLLSLTLLLSAAVGGTLAFLIDTDGPVENEFTPSKVTTDVDEKIDGGVKTNVRIKNTGNTTAYIRAYYIVTWQNDKGEVYGAAPVPGTDYTVTGEGSGWLEGEDGFWYWPTPVKSDDEDEKNCYTGYLLKSIEPKTKCPDDTYTLHVEVVGSGIQSVPKEAFDAWASESGISYGPDKLTK